MKQADDFLPCANWDRLRLRAKLLSKLREFFSQHDFLEVETPLLSADTVVDRHLDPLTVFLPNDPSDPQTGRTLWLQTSPEFCMKRLMAAGAPSIYQVTRAFRAGEQGKLHNPEFTMVEWYRRDDSMKEGMQFLSDLSQELLGFGPAIKISYQQAFDKHLDINPHTATTETLRQAAQRLKLNTPSGLADSDRDTWLHWLLADQVQPHLGLSSPEILYDYPASQAALAQVAGDPPVAKRFELYVQGIELANGYLELLDGEELLRRNIETNAQRIADGKQTLPEQSRLITAMQHGLPACCGVALGFDRLVMIAAGASSLAEVLAFPVDRA